MQIKQSPESTVLHKEDKGLISPCLFSMQEILHDKLNIRMHL